jgi:hypothetical protein
MLCDVHRLLVWAMLGKGDYGATTCCYITCTIVIRGDNPCYAPINPFRYLSTNIGHHPMLSTTGGSRILVDASTTQIINPNTYITVVCERRFMLFICILTFISMIAFIVAVLMTSWLYISVPKYKLPADEKPERVLEV